MAVTYRIVTGTLLAAGLNRLLEGFPLVHEVSDLPHEAMVLRHNCLCNFPIVIETGGGHLVFEVPQRLFPFGYSPFEV